VVISRAFSAVSWAWRGRVRRGMRQRRGVNFMGNSYMGWRKKGKGFLRGGREQVEGAKCKEDPPVHYLLFFHLEPVPLHLTPAFIFRQSRFWLTIFNSFGP
jgi:hypothetical protein